MDCDGERGRWRHFWCEISKVQYSTAHYSTVQYSTVQYSTVKYITRTEGQKSLNIQSIENTIIQRHLRIKILSLIPTLILEVTACKHSIITWINSPKLKSWIIVCNHITVHYKCPKRIFFQLEPSYTEEISLLL